MPFPAISVPWPWEVTLRGAWSEDSRGIAWAWYGMCESSTVTLWESKSSATQHGRDTAWAQHGLCEGSALCWRTIKRVKQSRYVPGVAQRVPGS